MQSTKSVAGALHRSQRIILNTRATPEAKELVAQYGYTDAALNEGQRLHDAAVAAVAARAQAVAAHRQTTQQACAARSDIYDAYQRIAQAARAIYPADSPERQALNVNQPRPTNAAALTKAAGTLFNNALNVPEIAETLAGYGFSSKVIQHMCASLDAYRLALQAQEHARSSAIDATAAQRRAMAALQHWTAQYVKLARVALRGRPELLRALGVGQPTGVTRRQRALVRAVEPAHDAVL